jgi:hypothetical protein
MVIKFSRAILLAPICHFMPIIIMSLASLPCWTHNYILTTEYQNLDWNWQETKITLWETPACSHQTTCNIQTYQALTYTHSKISSRALSNRLFIISQALFIIDNCFIPCKFCGLTCQTKSQQTFAKLGMKHIFVLQWIWYIQYIEKLTKCLISPMYNITLNQGVWLRQLCPNHPQIACQPYTSPDHARESDNHTSLRIYQFTHNKDHSVTGKSSTFKHTYDNLYHVILLHRLKNK